MIIETELIHGGLPCWLGRHVSRHRNRPRTPRRRQGFTDHAVHPAADWQPGFGEWHLSIMAYQQSQARKGLDRPLRLRERIAAETGILPRVVAAGVCEEAGLWLGVSLPHSWGNELAEHSEVVYQHNARFRRQLGGKAGPQRLWIFTRHWLCALLHSRRPDFLARLPCSYASGHDLPPRCASPPARAVYRPHCPASSSAG